jgi:hypothetical protein
MNGMTFQFFDAFTGVSSRKGESTALWQSEHALYRLIARLLQTTRG